MTHYDLPKETTKKCKDATIAVETFFVNLISRSDRIKFLTVSFMVNRTKITRFNLLKTLANIHVRKSFKVRVTKIDGDFE